MGDYGIRRMAKVTGAGAAALTLVLTAGILTTAAGPASASSSLAAAPAATTAAAPHSPSITFYFGLKRPEARADAAFYAVQNPASRSYRRFLSLPEVSRRYGASAATRTAFATQIRKLGLSSRVDPSGVFARVTGTVTRLDRAFHVRIKRTFTNFPNVYTYTLPAHQRLRLLPERPRMARIAGMTWQAGSACHGSRRSPGHCRT